MEEKILNDWGDVADKDKEKYRKQALRGAEKLKIFRKRGF
jgi:hypothetical protein